MGQLIMQLELTQIPFQLQQPQQMQLSQQPQQQSTNGNINFKVTEIMTPRVVVAVADENLPLQDFLKNKDYLNFSRIPIYSGNDENITGYVFRQQVFEKLAEENSQTGLVGFNSHYLSRSLKFLF